MSEGAGATGGVAVANEPKSWVMCVLLVFLGVAQVILLNLYSIAFALEL